jgi:hypothetical protein
MSIFGIAGSIEYIWTPVCCEHVFQAQILTLMALRTVWSEADQTKIEACWLCTTATSGKHTKYISEEPGKFGEWIVSLFI